MNTTVRSHLAARRLEERPAGDDEVAGFWRKAVQAYGDARNPSSSPENRFDVARSLASSPELEAALNEVNGLRTLRHAVEYDFEDDVDSSAAEAGIRVAEKVINLGAKHLRHARPSLARRIRMVNPSSG
ncbi:MAG TPA: hypothetical protein VFX98_14685 [Longimicrobiaceae bacterium]|nr:hypothetical protein [Longimicrobiaceae bacterium]